MSPSSCRSRWASGDCGQLRAMRCNTARPPNSHCSQRRAFDPAARGLDVEVGTHLLEGDFNRPATSEGFDDLLRSLTHIGREEIFVAVRRGQVMHEDPQNLDQSFARLYQWPVPVTTSTRRDRLPYQFTVSLVFWTTSCGLGNVFPFTRGRPLRASSVVASEHTTRDWHRSR